MLYHFFFHSTYIDELLTYLKCMKEIHRELNLNPYFLYEQFICTDVDTVECDIFFMLGGGGGGGGGRGNVTHLLKSVKEMEKSTGG